MVITRKFALPLSIAAGTYACVIRPHLLHWGATTKRCAARSLAPI